MSKQHSDSPCAKSSRTTRCKCQMCWGLMHGAQELDLNGQIEKTKQLLSHAKGDGDGGIEVECIRFYRSVVLKKYIIERTGGVDNLDVEFEKLVEKVSAWRTEIKENLQEEWATFEGNPEDYIKNYCLDVASKQVTQQLIGTLIPGTDKGQGVKKCIELIVEHEHLYCVICVAILKLVEKGEKDSSKIASAIAEGLVELIKLFGDLPKETERIIKVVVKTILAKAFSQILKATILSTLPHPLQNETTVRMLGIITCPNMEKHSDVVKYCAKPLLGEMLEDDIRNQLNKFYDQAMKREDSCPAIEFSFS